MLFMLAGSLFSESEDTLEGLIFHSLIHFPTIRL